MDTAARLAEHVENVRACVRCPRMRRPAVPGYPSVSRTMLIGQAPGRHEPVRGRPFAWTAGKTLFRWFWESCAIEEERFRRTVYMAAVCRCFPGETPLGGDRVPDRSEVAECSRWLGEEFEILRPELVIPVGRLAILQLLPPAPLTEIIGQSFRASYAGYACDVIPLPHPSGASPWPRMEPGRGLTRRALELIREHPAFSEGGGRTYQRKFRRLTPIQLQETAARAARNGFGPSCSPRATSTSSSRRMRSSTSRLA